MRLMLAALLTTALLAGCASTPIQDPASSSVAARDGSSVANAVIIRAPSEAAGVAAEYQWIAERFPGYTRKTQSLLQVRGHFYDALEIVTASGEERTLYFDITDFFGKL